MPGDWQLPQIPIADGEGAMEFDRQLLAAAEEGACGVQLYTWQSPWITLGRWQTPEEAIVPGCGVPYTLRPTGGGAVLHGHDLTLGYAVPLNALADDAVRPRSVRCIYEFIIEPLLEFLKSQGSNAVLPGKRAKQQANPDCFASTSDYDIVEGEGGRKICGCALKIGRKAALLQASVPLGDPLISPEKVITGAQPEDYLGRSIVLSSTADPVSWVRILERCSRK